MVMTGGTGFGGGPYFQVGTLTLDLFVGINAAGSTAPVDIGGFQQDAMFRVHLGTPTWNGDPALTSDYCTIAYDLNGRANAPGAQAAGFWFLIDGVDPTNASTDCVNIDPLFSTDVIADFGGPGWLIYLGGPVPTSIAGLLNPDFFGGFIDSPVVGPVDTAGIAYESIGGVVTLSAGAVPTVLPPATVPSITGVNESYIVGVIPWLWTF